MSGYGTDYVGMENRETFEQLRDALGDRPVDIPMRVKFGFYPRYRLLVTYFIEKKGWSVDQNDRGPTERAAVRPSPLCLRGLRLCTGRLGHSRRAPACSALRD